MDDLIQQECLIESQLQTYQSQLSLVEQQLEASDVDPSDLQQLKKDLSELIGLVQENLLEVKKQKLLLVLEGSSVAFAGEDTTEAQHEDVASSASGSQGNAGEEEKNGLQGMQCQAPLTEAWGAVNYHNAVIVCRESDLDCSVTRPAADEGESKEDFKVRVLFTHPSYNRMKPCSFFMEGKCKFSEETCKFSHGHVVSFSELQPFQDPDFSLVHIGGKCLAKHTDGLWHPAIVSSFGELFTVHFTTLNSTTQLEPDSVLPLESSDDSSSSDSSDSDSGEEGDESEGVRVVEWRPTGAQQALGEWEKHTTGIGSKLMAKMGYVVGKGLGKDDQGRVEPVEIVILPTGKSLDVCAELREAKKLRKPVGQVAKRRRRNRTAKKLTEVLKERQLVGKRNVFDFLNTKIFKKGHQTTESQGGESFILQKDMNACSKSARNSSENLNVKLFKVQEETKSVKKRRQSLQQSLLRHKERKDKTMVAQVQEKLATNERLLARLLREEQTIQRSITTKTERRKLSVF